ncbi:MAG: hypothetical protein ACI4F4_07490 [Lachnospiraceae bacterium]
MFGNKNMGLLIDEICETIEKNNIMFKYLIVVSGPIRVGPDDCDSDLIIVTEDGHSLYFNYEKHGFAPPSCARIFANRLAFKFHLFVEPYTVADYIRGYDQVSNYRLVKENPELKEQEKKRKWKKLIKC